MKFHDFYRRMAQMVDKFVNIPNRVLLYQLYNYISDMRSVTAMVNSHIKWHGETCVFCTGTDLVLRAAHACQQGVLLTLDGGPL